MSKTKKQQDIYNKKGPNFVYIISVIILLGMIVSAVIVIRNVNKEYRIRQIAGDFQKYKYAYLSFNNVYSGIPGDLEKATFYWQSKTEDGNGDRKIELIDSKEVVLAWQHLQLAKLIDNATKYSGNWKDGQDSVLIPGFNIPKGLYENTGYFFKYDDEIGRNIILFSGMSGSAGSPDVASLTSSEAYNLDLVIDDGMPQTGNIKVLGTANGECHVAGEYKLSNEIKECIAILEI